MPRLSQSLKKSSLANSPVVPQIEIRILNIDVMLVSGFLLAITIETENLVWRLIGYNYFFSIKFEVYGSCFLEA